MNRGGTQKFVSREGLGIMTRSPSPLQVSKFAPTRDILRNVSLLGASHDMLHVSDAENAKIHTLRLDGCKHWRLGLSLLQVDMHRVMGDMSHFI